MEVKPNILLSAIGAGMFGLSLLLPDAAPYTHAELVNLAGLARANQQITLKPYNPTARNLRVAGLLVAIGGLGWMGLERYQRQLAEQPPTPANSVQPTDTTQPARQLQPTEWGDKERRLWAALVRHEDGWLTRLMEPTALLIFGRDGSGKSRLARSIVMLRVLFRQHQVRISDPHAHQNDWGQWDTVGAEFGYPAIAIRIREFDNSCKGEKPPATTWLWDEFTDYQDNLPDSQGDGFLTRILANARKANGFHVLVGHGDTATALGGSKGTFKMRDRGLPSLELHSAVCELGRPIPATKATLKGLDWDESNKPINRVVSLPEWLNPEFLLTHFEQLAPEPEPIIAGKQVLDPLADDEPTEPELDNIRQRLEFLIQDNPPLSDTERSILDFAKSQPKQTVSARTVKRSGTGSLRQLSTDKIREIFQGLVLKKKGTLTDAGDFVATVADP
jgi:hypothetical protein